MASYERAEKKYRQALDRLDEVPADDDGCMNDIAVAAVKVGEARLHLLQMVAEARANGRTWDQIALVTGTTKQAARERFGS